MNSPNRISDFPEGGYGIRSRDDGWSSVNGVIPTDPLTLEELQVKFCMRTIALGKALEYANQMPSFSERHLSDILEMLKYVNNIVQVMVPQADMGYDLPPEVMEIIVAKLPAFLRMTWRELVKRGEGSGNDVLRFREWLVKRATDKMVETIDVLEENGFSMDTIFANELKY